MSARRIRTLARRLRQQAIDVPLNPLLDVPPRRPLKRALRWPALAGAFVAATHAFGANVDWASSRVMYSTNGSSIEDALGTFAAGQHLALRVDGHIEGVVSGRFDMPPARFLDTLAKSYGLAWYYDGAVLQVSPAGAQTRVAIRPNYLSAAALRAELDNAAVSDAHFPLELDERANTLIVHGPRAYVERVRLAARRLEGDAGKRVRTAVRVMRLRVANAADETRVIDGHTLTVPGAATLLRQRFDRRAPGSGDVAAAHGAKPIEFDTPLPVIEADATTNSIVIRDKPERIDADAVLISDLDVRPKLVSLETWVVDVDVDALDALGSALPSSLAVQSASARTGAAVVTDGGHALLARLDALEKNRRAQVEVSRTALTLDGAPAVIDQHEARLVHSDDNDLPDAADDASLDLWLSVVPTVTSAAPTEGVGLRVELGRGDDTRRQRMLDEHVVPGECLVISAPADTGNARRQRLVLLIPRIAA